MPSKSQAGSKPEKGMSSRLLTMKFMQRAAASKEQAQQTETPETSSPKRARVSTDAQSSPIAQPSELEMIEAAIAAEEDKRRDALSRQAAEAGETEWVLDYPGAGQANQQATSQPLVVAAGSLDDDNMAHGGRQAYGNFKRKKNNLSYLRNEDETDEIDPAQVKKSKPKPKSRSDSLRGLTSISGTGQSPGGGSASQKKRKHK